MAAWALLGLAHTGVAMARHHGWVPDASPGSAWTVGLPDNERAPEVEAVRQLIRAAPATDRVRIVVPPHEDTALATIYLRYQLGVLEYPTRIQLQPVLPPRSGAADEPPVDLGLTILAPDVPVPVPWGAPRVRVDGFRLYR